MDEGINTYTIDIDTNNIRPYDHSKSYFFKKKLCVSVVEYDQTRYHTH